MSPKISDVFFDLDHTLWDFEKNSALTLERILHENKINVDCEEFINHYVGVNFKYWELFRQEKISKEAMRLGRLQDTFALMNFVIADDQCTILADEYIKYLPESNHLFDGVFELLEYLKPNYNLHIITNGFHDVQNHKINNSNLGPYFKTVTNSELAGVKKPNPLIFEYALNLAKATKEQSVMIGDCINADVLGAINYGMDAILFSAVPQNLKDENIKQITHLLDLKKYL